MEGIWWILGKKIGNYIRGLLVNTYVQSEVRLVSDRFLASEDIWNVFGGLKIGTCRKGGYFAGTADGNLIRGMNMNRIPENREGAGGC